MPCRWETLRLSYLASGTYPGLFVRSPLPRSRRFLSLRPQRAFFLHVREQAGREGRAGQRVCVKDKESTLTLSRLHCKLGQQNENTSPALSNCTVQLRKAWMVLRNKGLPCVCGRGEPGLLEDRCQELKVTRNEHQLPVPDQRPKPL